MIAGKRRSAALLDSKGFEFHVPFLGSTSLHDLIFCLFLGGWLCAAVFGTSTLPFGAALYRVSTITFVLLVLNDFLLDTHSRIDMLLFVVLGLITVNAHRVGNTPFGMNLMILYCARHVDFRKAVLVSLAATAASVLVIVMCGETGILKDVLVPRGTGMRHSLGFSYATYLSHYFLGIALGYFFLRKHAYTYWELGIAIALDLLIYRATDSRTSFLLLLMTLIILAVVKMMRDAGVPLEKPRKLVAYIAPLSHLICAIVACGVLLWVPASSSLGVRLDSKLSGRLALSQNAFETYPVQALGNEVRFSGWSDQGDGYMVAGHSDEEGNFVRTKYSFVDSSYLQILVVEGWIPFATVLTLLTLPSIWLVQQKEYSAAGLLCVFAIHSIIDSELGLISFCCLLFAACRQIDLSSESAPPGRHYVRVLSAGVPIVALVIAGVAYVVNYGVPVAIDEKSFPNASMRAYVSEKVDVDGDGKLSKAEALRLTSMSISDATSIEGLEAFPNLTSLRASGTSLVSVDLSGAGELTRANFSAAENLDSLTLNGNEKLTSLDVRGTALDQLDLSGAPRMNRLECGSNVTITGATKAATYLLKSYSETYSDPDGQVSKRNVDAVYDNEGRLTQRRISADQSVIVDYEYGYDDKLNQVTLSGNESLNGTWTIRYGDDGSLHAEGSNGQYVVRECDDAGRVKTLDIKSWGLEGLLEAQLEFGYDEYDMLSTVRVTSNGTNRVYFVAYSSNGTLRSITSKTEADDYGENSSTTDEVTGGDESRNYGGGNLPVTERFDSSGAYTYDWQRYGKDATIVRRHIGTDSNISKVTGTYHYEGTLPYPIWGNVECWNDSHLTFEAKYERRGVSKYDGVEAGDAMDLSDLTEPDVFTDYWLPKADLWWLVEHEVRRIAAGQDTSLTCSGGTGYYDEDVYAETNKAYDSCLRDALQEVGTQYGGTPSYAYYDIDGDQDTELLVANGQGDLVRIYGQLQCNPYLSKEAENGEVLQLSSQGFLVVFRGEEQSLEQFNGLRFDVVEGSTADDSLGNAYPALQGVEWKRE